MPIAAGTRISSYTVLSPLGAGGMGEVYLAEDSRLGRKVAIKVLPSQFVSDPDRLRRFELEARAASALQSANVAHIYDIGEADGVRFIAMEYIDGETLEAAIGGRPLSALRLIDIALQIGDALEEAHAKRILHRDLKPSNVKLTSRGQAKVLDFGLAKLGGARDEKLATQTETEPGRVLGTVRYMSPEQALGREIDGRSDIFSFGAVHEAGIVSDVSPKTLPTAVIIPARDEELAIARVIAEIPPRSCHQVVVVDNGSRDRTAEVARGAGAQVVYQPEIGYGHACRAGLTAVRPGTEVIAFLDGDYSDYPEDLPVLTEPIYGGRADLVLGSRSLRPENRRYLPLHQRCGNLLSLALVRALYGRTFTDFGPFRAIRTTALEQLGMRDETWGWNVEMQIRAIQAGLRIEEVSVRYRHRIGRSKISGTLQGSVAAGSRMLYTIVRLRARTWPSAQRRDQALGSSTHEFRRATPTSRRSP